MLQKVTGRDCWKCMFYNDRSYLVTTGEKNVSGGVAWYRIWSRYACDLYDECFFLENTALLVRLTVKHDKLMRERSLTCSML